MLSIVFLKKIVWFMEKYGRAVKTCKLFYAVTCCQMLISYWFIVDDNLHLGGDASVSQNNTLPLY
jgi:hypothetical protein